IRNASTRTRTRNLSFEARSDHPFHYRGANTFIPAEGKGVEPSSRRARTALAERPGQPYPATFRSVDSPGVEPGSSDCQPDVFPLDHEPASKTVMIPDGIEPSISWMSPRCLRRWTTGSC